MNVRQGRTAAASAAVLGALALGGCVTLKSPEKPIEINLNVTIKQEVLVRLQKDVDTLINQNPDAFGQKPSAQPAPRK